MFSRILILFLFTSCSLFKGSEKITSSDTQKILSSVKIVGEGKGRLHIRERQYLFGMESVVKDGDTWIMAVSIPLHGEEALIFPRLKENSEIDPAMESFAMRIDAGIRENFKDSELRGKDFIQALRKTVRFLLAPKLGLTISCDETMCRLGDDEFQVEREEKTVRVMTNFTGHQLITTASNLTGPFFLHTQFRVLSPLKKQDLLSLELFWNE